MNVQARKGESISPKFFCIEEKSPTLRQKKIIWLTFRRITRDELAFCKASQMLYRRRRLDQIGFPGRRISDAEKVDHLFKLLPAIRVAYQDRFKRSIAACLSSLSRSCNFAKYRCIFSICFLQCAAHSSGVGLPMKSPGFELSFADFLRSRYALHSRPSGVEHEFSFVVVVVYRMIFFSSLCKLGDPCIFVSRIGRRLRI